MSTDDSADQPRELLGRLVLPWRSVPALVYDRYLTVRVANALAVAVHPSFRPGANLALATFLQPEVDGAFRASPESPNAVPLAARVVAELRRALDEHDEDRGFVELVGELAARSEAFARLWADPVAADPAGVVLFDNPVVGHVALAHHRFAVPGPAGDTLLLWRGADEESAGRLASLGDTLGD